MSSFFDQRYYSLNKLFMCQYGIWPEQSLFLRIVIPPISFIILISIIIPEMIRIRDVSHDLSRVMEGLPVIFTMITSLTKLFNGAVNVGKMRRVITRVSEDWKTLEGTKGIEVLHKYAAHGRFLTALYAIYIYGSTVLFLILPVMPSILDVIIPLNESRPKMALFEAEYGVDPDDYFVAILIHSYVTTVTTVGILVTVDSMFFVNVQHACALFKIVGVNLQQSLDDNYSNEDEHFKALRYCMNLHKDALSFADLLESTYSTTFAMVMVFYLLGLSLSGVLVVLKMGHTDEMVRFVILALAVASTLYLNSVPGQKLIDHSQDIHSVAYDFEWYNMSTRIQRLVVPMMIRSMRPCVLTAGKVYVISMANYSSVMQKSMSYFTVFTSMI